MRRWMMLLLALLLLAGGDSGQGEAGAKPPLPESGTETAGSEETPQHAGKPETDAAPDKAEPVSLSWEGMSTGTWPLDCTLETLQFVGSDDEELDAANRELRSQTEFEWQMYQNCTAMSEEERVRQNASWANLWAYPVSGERYLNAVWVWRQRMHFHTVEREPWNLVGSIVYDTEQGRIIPLEEAMMQMSVDLGDLERAVVAFTSERQIGICEKVNSAAFYLEEDGTPVFLIGAIVNQPEKPIPWPTFFTWKNGVVEWTQDHPLPLFLVDQESQDQLSCLQGMGQYDGAAVISEEEAAGILSEIYEVQEYLSQGMRMMFDGTSEWINEEYCICVALGTDGEESFVREAWYAVTYGVVYRMDPLSGEWQEVGVG